MGDFLCIQIFKIKFGYKILDISLHSYEEFVCISLQNSRSLTSAQRRINEALISQLHYEVKEKLSLGLQTVIW